MNKMNKIMNYQFQTLLACIITLYCNNINAQCTPATATSPFPNGDFNMFTPPASSAQLANANGWSNASDTTPDLFASGAYLGGTGGVPVVSTPSPNGGAWAGFLTFSDDTIGPPTYYEYEYIARALDTNLTEGVYDLVVDLGAPGTNTVVSGGDQTLDIVVHGVPLAASLPYTGGFGSRITDVGIGAVELGRFRITLLQDTWQTDIVIPLTVPAASNFEVLAISGDNVDPTTGTISGGAISEYTLIDNIRLTLNLSTDPSCCPAGTDPPTF